MATTDDRDGSVRDLFPLRANGRRFSPDGLVPAPGDWPCQENPVGVPEPLVAFLYRVLRDGAGTPGEVEGHAIQALVKEGPVEFTNAHLEWYARSGAAALTVPRREDPAATVGPVAVPDGGDLMDAPPPGGDMFPVEADVGRVGVGPADGFAHQINVWRGVRDGTVDVPPRLAEFAVALRDEQVAPDGDITDVARRLATLYVDAYQSARVSTGHGLLPDAQDGDR